MQYELALKCSTCNARLTFFNEQPEWVVDREQIEADLQRAREYVERTPRTSCLVSPSVPLVGWRPVGGNEGFGATFADREMFVCQPDENDYRYVECPACGGRAYIGSDEPGTPMEVVCERRDD